VRNPAPWILLAERIAAVVPYAARA
jgi:hypothetical protein